MKKTIKRHFRSLLSLTIIFSLILAVFAPIEAAAYELSGYKDGAVVRFKNVYTGYYLNLSGANNSNGANVNIFQYDGSPEETWKLRYDETNDVYLIGSMVSSNGDNRVIDVKRGGQAPKTGCNVQLYSATDPTSQQWVFQYHSNGRYTIRLKAATGLALTASTVRSAAGTYNGTSTGTLPTSPGNVFISSLPGYDANGASNGSSTSSIPTYQLWEIEEVNPQRTIADGIYTIRNAGALTMMGVTSTGNVEAQASDNSSFQRWKVTYNSDGFYTISPVSDLTKFLAVSGPSYDIQLTNIGVEACSPTADRAKWKIVPNATGTGYRIACKAGYYAYVAWVAYNSTLVGANIIQVGYGNAATQRWLFTPKYSVQLDIIYDNAYLARYPVSRINVQMETLQQKFFSDFGIWIQYTSPTKFTSHADTCPKASRDDLCECAEDKDCVGSPMGIPMPFTYHHTNIDNIMARVSLPDTNTTVKAVFIGHPVCWINGFRQHKPGPDDKPLAGRASMNYGLMAVMHFATPAEEANTIVHEFGHLFGAKDHYGGTAPSTEQTIIETGDNRYNRKCIYGEEGDGVSLTICGGCRANILENRDRYSGVS